MRLQDAAMPDEIQSTPIGPRWRLPLFALIFISLTAIGLAVVYRDVANEGLVFDRRLLQPGFLAAAAALLLLHWYTDGARLHYTLRALGHDIPPTGMVKLVFINLFFSNITPLVTGGGFAQIWYLRRLGVPVGTGTSATTIRTMIVMVLIFAATPVLLLVIPRLQDVPLRGQFLFYLLLILLAYLAFFGFALLRPQWLLAPTHGLLKGMRWLRMISSRRHRDWRFAAERELLHFARGFRDYFRGGWGNVLLSLANSVLYLVTLFSFPALILVALGYEIDWFLVLGLMTVLTFIMYFSPTPGAAGIAEGVFGFLFADLAQASHLLLVVVAWRFLSAHLGMLIGAVITHREVARG